MKYKTPKKLNHTHNSTDQNCPIRIKQIEYIKSHTKYE